MKQKLLNLAAALLLCSASASAQTDVTSTYLTNADFSQGTPIGSNLKGYGKDGTPYGFQSVDGWTSVVTSGDNSNTSYPNSGMGGAVFAYGSSYQLQGNNKAAPATNPNGEASGNCLGFFAVWGCGGYYYQNVTFPAGKYTITVPMYSQSGAQNNASFTGFFPTSGTNRTVAVNPTVGQWVNQSVTFTLTAETAGQIRVGYQSNGSGSSANPHLFIDCVKIEYTATVVKDVLENAITAATAANNVLNDADLAQAITDATAVLNDSGATQDQINDAAATLNAAIEVAMDGKDVTGMFVINPGFESCTVSTDNAAAGGSAAPRDIAGSWTQNASAAWSSSAVVEYGGAGQVNGASAPSADNLSNGGYTLGVSVGWGGTVTYKTDAVTLPAGVYNVTVNGYNALSGVTQFKSMFGFVPTEGTATMSTKTSFAYGEWEADQITFTLNEATEGYFQVGGQAISGGSGANAKVFFDNITITYSSFLAGARKAWQDAVAAAEAAKLANPNVIGLELTALNTELGMAEPTTLEDYNSATANLTDATAELEAAAPAYNAMVELNARAAAIAYEPYLISETTSAAELTAALPGFENSIRMAEHATEVEMFNQMLVDYPYEIALGNWTTSGAVKNQSSQHWNGDANATYNEPDSWGSNTGGTSSWTQEITLPAGNYMLQIAGRHSNDSELSVSVKDGENVLATTSDFPAQGTGYGIDMDGNANYDMNGDFANSGNGWGWAWRSLDISLGEEKTITIVVDYSATVGQQWASFTSYVIRSQFPKEKIDLLNAIKAAQAVDLTANVGTGVFQKNFVDDGTLSTAITTAQEVYDNAYATTEIVNDAITTLNNTKDNVVADYEGAELNAPADGQLFNIILTYDGWTYDGKAITFIAGGGNPSAGNYAIQYKEAANTNLAQAFTFTKVEGNKYKMSQIDADGVARYISTGVPYSGNANQIRTVTEADKALLVEVIPTNVEGVYNLRNTEANNYIGSQDAGVFTVNSHIDFALVETTKPSITVNTTAAGWGTLMLPFAVASLPTDVKAYTCAAIDGQTLTLTETTALEANKPYIIEGAWNETLSGDAMGTALTAKEGFLTGVYTDTPAIADTYVLQSQSGVVGFYQVETAGITTVKANHAYLTDPSSPSSGVKAFFLGGNADAIQSVFTKVAAGEIYDLAGRKVQKMQKGGVYIIDGKKVSVK